MVLTASIKEGQNLAVRRNPFLGVFCVFPCRLIEQYCLFPKTFNMSNLLLL